MDEVIRTRAHAKVNLFLRVLSREADGFHGIETLFCRISLADELVIERIESGVTLETSAGDLGPAAKNLAVRAAEAVLDATGRRFGVRISLTKLIPVGAGLGGGSSDAAAVLVAVNGLAGNAVPRHELLQFAARLGSDVPFFVSDAALALAWAHGDRFIRVPPLPPAPVLVLAPARPVATAEAYGWLDAARSAPVRRGALALDLDALATWGDVGRMAGNDFESVVFEYRPELRAAFEALAATRPLVCRMSGSGASLFAVYRSPRDRDDARMMLGRKHGTVLSAETLAGPPAPV
jgi:4-diphosphocytidyl-2-C-methyl-D-erythritol kinase